jgi:hypothetical protein
MMVTADQVESILGGKQEEGGDLEEEGDSDDAMTMAVVVNTLMKSCAHCTAVRELGGNELKPMTQPGSGGEHIGQLTYVTHHSHGGCNCSALER